MNVGSDSEDGVMMVGWRTTTTGDKDGIESKGGWGDADGSAGLSGEAPKVMRVYGLRYSWEGRARSRASAKKGQAKQARARRGRRGVRRCARR